MLGDPFAGKIELGKMPNDNDPYIYTPVVLFAGWVYDGHKGMLSGSRSDGLVTALIDPYHRDRLRVLAADMIR